ncbi:hypothetical protein BGZ83_010559 [Gryganskiella cystojenkinii]|nr:hypothetical protein BGZ83_010559 [Gryganskiella cystojenkinii]
MSMAQHATPLSGSISGPDIRIPFEIWEKVYCELYLSQLSRLSMTSKTMFLMVGSSQVWKSMIQRCRHAKRQRHLDYEILLPVRTDPRADSRSFMRFLCTNQSSICEVCLVLGFGGNDKVVRALASRIYAFYRSPQAMYDDEGQHTSFETWNKAWEHYQISNMKTKEEEEPWTVRLCLPCRQILNERLPDAIDPELEKSCVEISKVRKKYPLSKIHMKILLKMFPSGGFPEDKVLFHAREAYGGDVGIEAMRKSKL